jgi:hypothetical protein
VRDPLKALEEIHQEFELYVHKIRGRIYQSIAIALPWFSPLQIIWEGKKERGWLEVLVFGDTSQGKSAMVKRFQDHFQAGVFRSGKATSVAGLLAGARQLGGSKDWVVKPGLLPRCHGGLLSLDEYHGVSSDTARAMSQARSEGIVHYDKIVSFTRVCMVRKHFLANCINKEGESVWMAEESFPIRYVPLIMHSPEDTRRLDYAVGFATSQEIRDQIFSPPSLNGHRQQFDSSRCASLVHWIWSRTAQDVIFLPETEAQILTNSRMMADRYDCEIPLVEAGDARIKLARVSAAVAGHLFSADESGEKLLVKPEHVDAAFSLLEWIYHGTDTKFAEYAEHNRTAGATNDKVVRSVGLALDNCDRHDGQGAADIVMWMRSQSHPVTYADVNTLGQLTELGTRMFFEVMVNHGLVRQSHSGFKLNRKGALIIGKLTEWHLTALRPFGEYMLE